MVQSKHSELLKTLLFCLPKPCRLGILLLLCGASLCISTTHAQTFQLYAETFEVSTTGFNLNEDTVVTPPIGTNRWVINDEYNGAPTYGNTPNQDSTFFGTIAGAPFSTYLHIHDTVAAVTGPSNANYNSLVPSDNFAAMGPNFCTLGLSNITFTFFYIAEGNADDYGEVYYQADDGPWTKTGLAKYNNTSKWQYEVITDTLFEDVEELRFGFRWVNAGTSPTSNVSFGIDDIIVVADYDSVSNPVDITIDFTIPDPICQLNNLIIGWSLSKPLCEGVYQVELSGPGGGYASSTSLGVFTILANDTTGAIAATIPASAAPDSCYTVRINRVSPLPEITGVASGCFEVQECPNTITTLQPVVTYDTNAVCVNSVIDVPFFSTGVFMSGNVYTAQLSDSAGNFGASPQVIGTLNSSNTFDPALGSPPGTVSGLIPATPPGCAYFIRVVSSIPATTGSLFGPFCIQNCDIETNEIEDIFVCISDSFGVTVDVPADVHIYDSIAMYCDSNLFEIEILDPMFFNQVNLGGLGFELDTTSTIITMTVPGYFDLLAMGLDAGVWYMRVNANCSSTSENRLGTLIHLTIGAPSDNPPTLIPNDTLVCEGDINSVLISPYNMESSYQWQFGSATPFVWPFNPIFINFTGATGPLDIRVREVNYGCPGPWSDVVTIDIIDEPNVNIDAPDPICTNDTVLFSVPFFNETFYDWGASGGTIVDTSNNEIRMIFDTAGIYTLDIFALNICGSGTGTLDVEVIDNIPVYGGEDRSLCIGAGLTLNGFTDGIIIYEWYLGDSLVDGGSLYDLTPDSTMTITLFGTTVDGCVSRDDITLTVEHPFGLTDSTVICPGEILTIDAGYPGGNYNWWNGSNEQFVQVNEPGSYQVVINTNEEVCPVTRDIIVEPILEICDPIVHAPNAFTPNNDTKNDHFTVYGVAVLEYQITIYNRWGEIMYNSADPSEVNDPSRGWDGRHSGVEQELGTYVYVISATGGNGNTINLRGNFSLLR